MVEIFIDGDRVEAEDGQTVMQAARASGHVIPFFCWHPALSVPGNCRVCMVEIEGDGTAAGWLDIACNMPVAKGMRVLTDSPRVRVRRRQVLELQTLNHPVDCGICDKAGECTLQDYHYQYNGAPSVSRDAKVRATKHFTALGADRPRQRALHPVLALRSLHARDLEVQRARHPEPRRPLAGARVEDGAFDARPVLRQRDRHLPGRRAPVAAVPAPGAGLVPRADAISLPRLRARLHGPGLAPQERMEAQSPRPGAERAHRPRHAAREPGRQRSVDLQQGRDLAQIFERPRALAAVAEGQDRSSSTRRSTRRGALIAAARRPVALVSSWGSNEELAAFDRVLAARFPASSRPTGCRCPASGSRTTSSSSPTRIRTGPRARALYPALPTIRARRSLPTATSSWSGAKAATPTRSPQARRSLRSTPGCTRTTRAPTCSCRSAPRPSATATTRTSPASSAAFQACFAKPAGVADAEALFAALSLPLAVEAT